MAPSLKEIRAFLGRQTNKGYAPAKIWTWAEALELRKRPNSKKVAVRKKRLKLSRESLDKVKFFYDRYGHTKKYTSYRCSRENFLRMSQDIYRVSRIVFHESVDLLRFFEESADILTQTIIKSGRLTHQNRGLDKYVRRMKRLRAFWEINMQNDGIIVDKREREVKNLKRSFLYSYDYMKKQVI